VGQEQASELFGGDYFVDRGCGCGGGGADEGASDAGVGARRRDWKGGCGGVVCD